MALLTVAPCAALAVGIMVGGMWKQMLEAPSGKPVDGMDSSAALADRARTLQAINDRLREELAGKEWRIATLEDEIEAVREGLPSPFAPEEQKDRREREERLKRKEWRKSIDEKANELRTKILQRRDKALRQEGLAELDKLVQSDDAEELIVGLTAFRRLPDFILHKKSYRTHVLTALQHEDPEARFAAVLCLYYVCSKEENLDTFVSLTGDPSPKVRGRAVAVVGQYAGNERNERVSTVLEKLLHDADVSVGREALKGLSSPGYDYREEMEDLVIELSRDPETREQAHICLSEMKTIDAKVAQRLVELYDSGRGWSYSSEWMDSSFTDDARPIACRFCLDLVWGNVTRWEKEKGLECLQRIGDVSVLRELETVERSPAAEGIEDVLTRTIESLRQKFEGQKQ